MNTCRLSGNDLFKSDFRSVLDKIAEVGPQELKKAYLDELKRLETQYKPENFFEELEEVCLKKAKDITRKIFTNKSLKELLIRDNKLIDYSEDLSTYDPALVESTLDLGSKFDTFDSTLEELNSKNAALEYFLNPYFPMVSGSRLAFEQQFKNQLILKLFFNHHSGLINKNGKEIDESIKGLREDFEKNLDAYIKLTQPDYYSLYMGRSLNSKVEYFLLLLKDGLFTTNSTELLNIPIIDSILNISLKTKLKAYTSYIGLVHFDDLISLALDTSVRIIYKGNYYTDKFKYSVNLGDRNVTSWSDDSKDIDETEQIGGLIRLYLESLNLYDPKTGKRLPFKMTFNDVKAGVTGIMKFLEVGIENGKLNINREKKYFTARSTDSNHIYNVLREKLSPYYGELGFKDIWNEYFLGKTLPQVIAAAKVKPNLLTPALFATLAFDKNAKFGRTLEFLGVYSLYKNIYDMSSENSLLYKIKLSGINLDSVDVYSFVNALFINLENLKMIEYRRESDGKVGIINLISNNENIRLNNLRYQWEGLYNVNLPQNFSFDLGEFSGKLLTVKIKDYTLNINIDGEGVIYSNLLLKGKTPENLTNSTILDFLSEVFKKKIDSKFIDLFLELGNNDVNKLILVAGSILYNYKLGKEVLKYIKNNTGKTAKELYDEKVAEFYAKNPPKAIRGLLLPELTNKNQYLTMINMAKVLDFLLGYSGETVGKDGSRKQISLVALSSLMSRYMELVYNHNISNPNSLVKDFKLYKLYEGVEFIRDYAGNDSKKVGTLFSENEYFAANFIYDFYGQLVAETSKDGVSTDLNLSSDTPTKLRIMGPVISDKPRPAKIVVDWKSKVANVNGVEKKLFELTPDEIYQIQTLEFGRYYKNLYLRVHRDLASLLPLINLENKNKFSIVWAHPNMGKSWSVKNGKFADLIIDWDVEYNHLRDLWIAEHSGTVIDSPEFLLAKYEYIVNYENHEDYKLFLVANWNLVKAKAQELNKILLVSPHSLLKLFPKDFNVVINLSKKELIRRNVERGGTEEDSIIWKESIDNTINTLLQTKALDQSKVFTTEKYMEDILADSTLDYDNDYETFNLYSRVRGLNPEELIHDAIYEFQQRARANGENENDIQIIDNVHFISGRDKQIHNNAALFHQLNIYKQGVPYKVRKNEKYLPNLELNTLKETSEQSRNRINLQLISDLLKGKTVLKVGVKDSAVEDNATKAAKYHNKEWLYTTKDGKSSNLIVYARIKNNVEGAETPLDIYSERALLKWKEYNKVLNLLKNVSAVSENSTVKRLVEAIDINSPKFDIDVAINTVNNFYTYTKLFERNQKGDRELRDKIGKTLKLPNQELLRNIIRNDFKLRNPHWGSEAIERNTDKRLQLEETVKKIYTNYYINKLIADLIWDPNESDKDILKENKKKAKKALSKLEKYVSVNEVLNFTIEINPELERYQTLNNWIYNGFMLTSVGSFIAHPGDNTAITILNYEYACCGLQVKRNVSFTATKHREMLDSLKGIRNTLKILVILDERDSCITFKGDYDRRGIKVHDGATFYNGTMNSLDNNSLGADAVGMDLKPYCHFFNEETGIGGMVKTAGFLVNNDRIRSANRRYTILNKHFNDTIKWTDTLRKHRIVKPFFNWMVDFNNEELHLNPIYTYLNGKWIERFGFKVNPTTGETTYFEQNVDEYGERYGKTTPKSAGIINSNYELWKLFGGEYSGHKNLDGKLSYYNDNNSFLNVNYVMNHTGEVLNPNLPVHSQANLLLVLKHSQLDIAATLGAMKFGPVNINSVEILDNPDYKPTYMEVASDDLGPLLNAEHLAEGGHVSLMTLVINALGARGFSREDAEECYEALENLALQSFEKAFRGLNENNRDMLRIEIANILLNALKMTSLSDGDILSAIAIGLNKMQKFQTYSDIEGRFPISSPLIFNNLFSKLASSLEKAAIRLKFDGGMLVLNPSNRIFLIINGKLSGTVTREELLILLNNALLNPILDSSYIRMGYNYFILGLDSKAILVDNINDFYKVLNAFKSGQTVIEAFTEEYSMNGSTYDFNYDKPLGRDLATYDLSITSVDGHLHSGWELDIVRQLHAWDKKSKKFIKQENVPQTVLEIEWNNWQNGGIKSELLISELSKLGVSNLDSDDLELELLNHLQKTLNAIGSGIGNSVYIDSQKVTIDKSKTKVSPYEAILPMMYKTTFGLEEGDVISDIVNDLMFFVKRFIKNAKTKLPTAAFDLELKRTSGEHIYLANSRRNLSRYASEILDFPTELVGEALYRTDPDTGKRLYLIPSKYNEETGIIEANCKIYKNRNGVEIIQTDDFLSILNLMEYTSVIFGDLSYQDNDGLKHILSLLEKSSNELALKKFNHVINSINRKVKTNLELIRLNNSLYIDAFTLGKKEELLDLYLTLNLTPIENVEQIFAEPELTNIPLNAFKNHLLYKQDAITSFLELLELEDYATGKKIASDEKGNTVEFLEWYALSSNYARHALEFGIRQHTSFLTSLQAIVSRTPAQSLQSFMTMQVVAFDSGKTNSIYVSRMLLFLQGSDFDIDKANFLGLKFNNGILVDWSPYFSLNSYEEEQESEKLPFPSGRTLEYNASPPKIAFDYLEKDYETYDTENGKAVVDNSGNGVSVITHEDGTIQIDVLNPTANNYLITHAVFDKISKGTKIIGNFNKEVFLVDENDLFTGIDNVADLKFFVNSYNLDGEYYPNLRIILKTFTKLGNIIPELEETKLIVDKHNTYFIGKNGKVNDNKKRNALYNFISIKAKNVSRDPINLVQGQSGVDVATEYIKDLVKPGGKFDRLSTIAETADTSTTYTRMKLLILTLTGKECVGIVASAMKVFEAISHYYYKVLAEGTAEDQYRLLSNVRILGKDLKLIANSYVKNTDSIKKLEGAETDDVLDAYLKVDNTYDAFIWMSALLSLATDNAKDPTLVKLNATPATIGCYTAGLVLGLHMDEIADLLVSDTGLLLSNMVKSNVFNTGDHEFSTLTDAIKYLMYPPKYPKDLVNLTLLFEAFGLHGKETINPRTGEIIEKLPLTQNDISNFIKDNRKRIRKMARYVLYKNEQLETDLTKIAKEEIFAIEHNRSYTDWNENKENELTELRNKVNRTKKEDRRIATLEEKKLARLTLENLKKNYQAYIDNPELASLETVQKLLKISDKYQELQDEKSYLNNLVHGTDDLGVKEFFLDVLDWTDKQEIIEKDYTEVNGKKYNRFRLIRKLNLFNEEMGDLRTVLKLNQGLPNSVKDQLSWINNFGRILSKAAYRLNRKAIADNDLGVFAQMNENNDLELNLHRFLNDKAYLKAAINAYEEVKVGVNILAVMANSSHYRGFMKVMNLLYEGSKATSVNYASQAWISKKILPTLKLSDPELIENFFKKITPVTFNRINLMFLWQLLVQYSIPQFKIIDGELIESFDDAGKRRYETIRLGTEEANNKFKDYIVNYVYPYLLRNYPNNPFVLAIGLRSYSYNLDHLVTNNLAKNNSYNMKNPADAVRFDEVKKGLLELNNIKGLVPALFYYNLIAYNGLAGLQSLTSFFEDFIVYDKSKTIRDYNNFITYLDTLGVPLWTDEDIPYLLKVLAPEVYSASLLDGKIPYAWIINPENNKYVLLELIQNESSTNYDLGDGQDLPINEYDIFGLTGIDPFETDDNEYGVFNKHATYKSMADIYKRAKGKYTEAHITEDTKTEENKQFILGTITLDSEFFNKNLLLSDLTPLEKTEFLKKNSKKIVLSINGENINLSRLLESVKENGWDENEVYKSFEFYKRKSRTEVYDYIDLDNLKSKLTILLNQNKKENCNG